MNNNIICEEKLGFYLYKKSKKKDFFTKSRLIKQIIKILIQRQKFLEVFEIIRYILFKKNYDENFSKIQIFDFLNYLRNLSISNFNQFNYFLEIILINFKLLSSILSSNFLHNIMIFPRFTLKYIYDFFDKFNNSDFENIMATFLIGKIICSNNFLNIVKNYNSILASINKVIRNDLLQRNLKMHFLLLKSKIMIVKGKIKNASDCLIEGFSTHDNIRLKFKFFEYIISICRVRNFIDKKITKLKFLYLNFDLLVSKSIVFFNKFKNLGSFEIFKSISLKKKKIISHFIFKKTIAKPIVNFLFKLFENFSRISFRELSILTVINLDILKKLISIFIFKKKIKILINIKTDYLIKFNKKFIFKKTEFQQFFSYLFSMMRYF